MFETVNILGVNIAVTTPEKTGACVHQWISKREKVFLCFAPVSTLVDCQRDPNYRQIVNSADMINPDGVPVVWVAHCKGQKSMLRTCGPDFMVRALGESGTMGHRHFFYGGTDSSKNLLLNAIKKRWPDAQIAGAIAPPFLAVGEKESQAVIDQINAANADYLWIGLGSPKQDVWMANHRDELNVPIMCGVGAAFDFIAETKPMAPNWMRKMGLEWFFRLCCEPKRLWRRYFIGNSMFLYYLMTKEVFSHE